VQEGRELGSEEDAATTVRLLEASNPKDGLKMGATRETEEGEEGLALVERPSDVKKLALEEELAVEEDAREVYDQIAAGP